MPRLLVRTLVLTAALVVGACSSSTPASPSGGISKSGAPSASPSAPRSANPSGRPPASLESFEPTATPSSLISCDLQPEVFEVSLHTAHGIADAHGDAATGAPATPEADAGELIGLQSYTADFSLDVGGHQVPLAPKSIEATVSVPGAAEQAKLDLHESSAGVTLPDGHGNAVLALVLTVVNAPCPDVFATIRFRFRLVTAATAKACPTGEPGFADLIKKLDLHVRFGPTSLPMTVQTFVGRFVNVAGYDSVPAFAGFDPGFAPLKTKAGQTPSLQMSSPGVTLVGGNVQVWRRSDVVGPDGRIKQTVGESLEEIILAPKLGLAIWTPPKKAGEYIVGLYPAWSQACVTGTGFVYFSLRVT